MKNKDATSELHFQFVDSSIRQAKKSIIAGGFPAGSVIVKDNNIIADGISIGHALHDPTAHSDIAAIRKACQEGHTDNLSGATLYSSMQPCLMCFAAAAWSGIHEIVYACSKEKVAVAYYAGHYNTHDITKQLVQPLQLTHAFEYEEASLVIVREWELSLK